jgi:hypothetical protein
VGQKSGMERVDEEYEGKEVAPEDMTNAAP